MYDTYNYGNTNTKDKKLVIVAAVLGVAALLAVAFLIINIMNKGEKEPEQKIYSVAEVREAANRYANFVIKGKQGVSEVDEIRERDGGIALETILDAEVGKEKRSKFVKTAKKLGKDLEEKLKYVEGSKIKKAEDYASMIEDVSVEINVINKFIDTSFDPKDYLEAFQKNQGSGVNKAIVKNYEDALLYYTLVHVAADNPEDGEEYIEYSEIASGTERILADFYKALIDYGEAVRTTLSMYKEKGCLGSKVVRATCKSVADESDVGKICAEDREIALKTMLEKIDEAKTDAIFVVQDVAQKVNK